MFPERGFNLFSLLRGINSKKTRYFLSNFFRFNAAVQDTTKALALDKLRGTKAEKVRHVPRIFFISESLSGKNPLSVVCVSPEYACMFQIAAILSYKKT